MNRRGFTLLEMLIAMGVTSIVIAVISIVLVKQSQASVKQTQQRSLEETGRQALLEIAYAVRMHMWGPIAFLLLFCFGYGYMGILSLLQTAGGKRLDSRWRRTSATARP